MDDLISRQAAIDALNEMKIYRPLDSDRWVISDCLNKIVNLPSAQPTIDAEPVRRGKWKVTPYTDYDDTYECSACGQWWMFVEGTPKENDANYCPNCGAKMEV